MSVEERDHGGVSCADDPVFLVVVLDLFFAVVRPPTSAKGLCRYSHNYRYRPGLEAGMCAAAPCSGAQRSFLSVSSRSRQNGGLQDRQGVRNSRFRSVLKRIAAAVTFLEQFSVSFCFFPFFLLTYHPRELRPELDSVLEKCLNSSS